MTIRKQNRCPTCGTVVDLASMVYSSASQMFVCPSCLRAGTRPPLDQPIGASAPPESSAPSMGETSAIAAPTLAPLTAITPSEKDVLSTLASMATPPQPSFQQQSIGAFGDDPAPALPLA